LSDDFNDLEQTDELEDENEVQGHIDRPGMTDDPDDEVEAHIRLDRPA
jgi:hypothetical protein